MKRVVGIIALVIIALLIVLVAVNMKGKVGTTVSDKNVTDIYENEFDFVVTEVTSKSLKYSITNNSEKDISYGADFEIEKYVDNIWQEYNIVIDFVEVANVLKEGKSSEEEIVFANYYGNLAKGKYRLLKYINGKLVSAEFDVR